MQEIKKGIAGDDKIFVWANAEIVDDKTVAVFSGEVKHPIAVRYAWADNPGELNLSNNTGMPAYPFRTDKFKGKTDDIKILVIARGSPIITKDTELNRPTIKKQDPKRG